MRLLIAALAAAALVPATNADAAAPDWTSLGAAEAKVARADAAAPDWTGLLAAKAKVARADAAASDWTYLVTAKATIATKWSAGSTRDIGSPGAPCAVVRTAAGESTTTLVSRKPTRMLVLRPARGLPNLDTGTGEGLRMDGVVVVSGSDVTTHEGAGTCASGNPPGAKPTTGCGRHTFTTAWSLRFTDATSVAPDVSSLDSPSDCPTDPGSALTWAGGTAPSLSEVLTPTTPKRFYGTRQFTLHGQRTFTAKGTEDATETVTITWETTYRLAH
jgi:hypothetical protein